MLSFYSLRIELVADCCDKAKVNEGSVGFTCVEPLEVSRQLAVTARAPTVVSFIGPPTSEYLDDTG